jgi:hypothetical protein
MSRTTGPAPETPAEVVTVTQAAQLIGRDAKTVRRMLPTEANKRKGAVRLPRAYRDGDGPTAPWLIPVTDLVAAGLCAPPTGAGSATGSEALARQRDERDLARLREDLARYRATDEAKTMLLADRDQELKRLRQQVDRFTDLLRQALTGKVA